MKRAVLRSDGGARGNPGPGGAGFVIEVDGEIVCRGGRFLGSVTNNIAEYSALIWGLRNAHALGIDELTVLADSELLVKQLNGQYRVKNEGLKPLFVEAQNLVRGFGRVEIRHIRREENKAADALANEAMDLRHTVGDAPVDDEGPAARTLF